MRLPHKPFKPGPWKLVDYDLGDGTRVRYLERKMGDNTVQRTELGVVTPPNLANPPGSRVAPRGLGPLDRPVMPFPTWDETDAGIPKVYPKPRPGPYNPLDRPGLMLPVRRPVNTIGKSKTYNVVRQGRAW